MAKQNLTYQVGIIADTSQFMRSMNEAFERLKDLSARTDFSSNIRDAATAAQQLQSALSSSMDSKTGRLDLTAFQQQLDNSNKTLKQYREELSGAGTDGRLAFASVAQAIINAEMPLKRTSKLMDELWVTMKNTMRWQLTSSVLNTFVGTLETAYGYSKDLDASLNNIRIVTSKNNDEMKEFAKYANEAAKALSTTTTKYTDASLIYYQQGLTDEEVKGRTDTTIKLANVTEQDVETTSEQLTAIWNNFYDGSQSLEYYVDIMTKLGATTASSSDEIAEGIQKFASVANTVGLSYEYAASALATLTANTRESASVVGTSLRTLFSRLQGLTLGETLEDGVDLNKYSEALHKVGVEVLDVNGNMREMDGILDDTASRWDKLSNAQQMALAQTVAGVRQYTTFVNLMENWGDFSENLDTAYGATGALEEQADIYAESWKAARDRVRAAAEDIYDSLINPDFYIGLDNIITPVLGGIADIVDSMGGLKGILLTVSSLTTTIYGDKMAQSLRNMAANIGFLANSDAQRAIALKQQTVAQLELELAEERENNQASKTVSIKSQKLEIDTRIAQLEQQLAEKAASLDEHTIKQLQAEIELLKTKSGWFKTLATQQSEAQSQVDSTRFSLERRATQTSRTTSVEDWFKSYQSQSGVAASKSQQKIQSAVDNAMKVKVDGVNENVAVMQQLEKAVQKNIKVEEAWAKAIQARQKYANDNESFAESLKEIAATYDVDIFNGFDKGTGEETLQNHAAQAAQVTADLGVAMVSLAGDTDTANKHTDLFINGTRVMIRTSVEASETLKKQSNDVDELGNKIDQANKKQKDWATSIVNVAQGLSQFGMVISSFQGLASVFTDEDASAGEKLISILTTVGMTLPNVISLMNKLNNATRLVTVSQEGQIAVGGVDITVKWLQDTVNKYLKKSTEGVAKADLKEAKAAAIKNIANLATLATYAALIAIIGVVVVITAALVKEYNKDAIAAKKATAAVENLTEAYADAKETATELRNAITGWDDAVDNLDTLTKGTEEYAEALEKANEKAKDLIKTYGLYGQAHYNSDGLLEFDDGVLDDLQDNLDKTEHLAENSLNRGKIIENLAQAQSDTTDFARKGLIRKYTGKGQQTGSLTSSEIQELVKLLRDQQTDDLSYDDYSTLVKKLALDNLGIEISSIGKDFRESMDTFIESLEDGEEANRYYAQQIGSNLVQSNQGEWLNKVSNGDEARANQIAAAAGGIVGARVEEKVQEEESLITESGVELVKRYLKDTQGYTDDQIKDLTITSTSVKSGKNELFTNLDAAQMKKEIAYAFVTESEKLSDEEQSWMAEIIGKADEAGKQYGVDFTTSLLNMMANYTGEVNIKDLMSDLSPDNWEELKQLSPSELGVKFGISDETVQLFGEITASEFLRAFSKELENYDPLQYWQSQYAKSAANLNSLKEVLAAYMDGEDLSDEQTAFLTTLASQYEELNNIREIGSHEYLQLLREIQEQEEDNALQALREQGDLQAQKVDKLSKQYQDALEDRNTEVAESLAEELDAAIEDVLSTERSLKVVIEADFDSDIDQAFGLASEFEKLASYLSDGLEITYKEAQEIIADGHGAMLQSAEKTASGTIKVNQTVADQYLKAQRDILNADKETKIKQLKGERVNLDKKIEMLKSAQEAVQAEATAETLAQAMAWYEQAELYGILEDDKKEDSDETQTYISDETKNFLSKLGVMYTEDVDNQQQANEDASESAIAYANQRIAQANAVQEAWVKVSNAVRASSTGEEIAYDPVPLIEEAASDVKTGVTESKAVTGTTSRPFGLMYKPMDVLNHVANKFEEELAARSANSSASESDNTTSSDSDDDTALDSHDQRVKEFKEKIESFISGGSNTYLAEIKAYYNELIQASIDAAEADKGAIDAAIAALESTYGSVLNHGSGSTKAYDKKDLLDLEDASERYHDINRQLAQQEDLLDDIGEAKDRAFGLDQLKLYEQELKALKTEESLLLAKKDEVTDYLDQDLSKVQELFGEQVQLDANGEIINAETLYKWNREQQNLAIEKHNQAVEGKELTEEEYAIIEAEYETATKLYEDRQKALEQYDDTLDEMMDTIDDWQENQRSQADKALEIVTKPLELYNTVMDMQTSINNLSKTMLGTFGDTLATQKEMLDLEYSNVEWALNKQSIYEEQWVALQEQLANADEYTNIQAIQDEIQNLFSDVEGSAETLIEWANTIEDIVPEAVSTAAEEFAKFTSELEHNVSTLEAIKELQTLQGVTAKTDAGLATLQKNLQARLDAQSAQAVLQKQWADDFEKRYNQAQAELDTYLANGGSTASNEYDRLVNMVDAYKEQWQEAEDAYLSLAKEAMETAQEMYLNELENAKEAFANALTDGLGLDYLQSKYDNLIEEEERYLDTVNEAYEKASWYNKLQQDIDDATNEAYVKELKALQDEINYRKESGKLSEYDLEILEAKYNVLQAQMALEDARNAKNNLQLVRDSQGNWNYQYTADQDQVASAEQDLMDAQNEWYNLAKDRVTEVTGDIVAMWQECQDEIDQIYQDLVTGEITQEQYLAKVDEIERYYTEKSMYLEQEKQQAIADMNEAGYESLKTTLADSGAEIDSFQSEYASQLASMTAENASFEEKLSEYLGLCRTSYKDYEDKVNQVARDTGTTQDNLAEKTNKVATATDNLREKGENIVPVLQDQIDIAQELSDKYGEKGLAGAIWKAIEAYRTMMQEMSAQTSVDAGVYNSDVDYSALMAKAEYGSDEYNLYKDWRAQKEENGYDVGTATTDRINAFLKKGYKLSDYGYDYFTQIPEEQWKELVGFDTGGYTGEFDKGKLALLHEKELVLNQEDTANILAAVGAVRNLGPEFFAAIEKALDGSVAASFGLMNDRLNTSSIQPVAEKLEQDVHIEAVFPSVTDHSEIEEAFSNLTNDASQFIRRRKE